MALYEDKNGSSRKSRDDKKGWKNSEGDKAVVTIKGAISLDRYVKVLQNDKVDTRKVPVKYRMSHRWFSKCVLTIDTALLNYIQEAAYDTTLHNIFKEDVQWNNKSRILNVLQGTSGENQKKMAVVIHWIGRCNDEVSLNEVSQNIITVGFLSGIFSPDRDDF